MPKHPNDYPKVQFLLSDSLRANVAQRSTGSVHLTAKRDLERYYWLISRSMPRLSDQEWSLMQDMLSSVLLDVPDMARLLDADLEEMLDTYPEQFEKWGVDAADIVAKVRAMSPAEKMAIYDRCERISVVQA